ncbi:hypothetical protein DSE42_23030 [Salmonella enterica]|nr:hypothetical protein [Salmonella enterica]EBS6931847.1 hypothetical protein [Salmonella enterica]EBT8812873.1 hypothetical protein [Salmonella enterica]ECD9586400.1 hypothetical protein [Salmonella enterica]ECK6529813.1 hypothetical protein [Salmonella enterica]
MSLSVVREQILNFVSKSAPSVMAIKGEWGGGKTFSWNKFLLEAKSENMISASRYSYVSLFGISSLDRLKYSIFENAVSKDSIGHDPSLDSLRKNTLGMLEILGRGSWSKLKELPYIKSAAPAIEAWSFMSVSDSLICIDDLERKGSSLELKDVLGLISLLKEQKKCKVILLLNDGTKEVADYEKFKEKVIDIELHFSPTPNESAQIAYDNSKDFHKPLAQYTISLGIKNIRILKKIERNVENAWRAFEGCESEVKMQFLHTVVLMNWAYFCSKSDKDIPTLDFLESMESIYSIGKKDATEEEKKWKSILLSYNFTRVDELDRKIAKLVRNGYIDLTELSESIKIVNKQVLDNKKSNSFRSAWDLFHNSFDDNVEEVVSHFYKCFTDSVTQVSPNDLDSLVGVFRELGEDTKASEMITYYIQERRSEIELFDVDNFYLFRPIKDEEIIEKFKGVYLTDSPKRTLGEVLDVLSGQNGWNDDDIEVLSSATEDDYYHYFKSLHGNHLTSHVATCMKFGRISNANEQTRSVSVKAKEALMRISGESKLNELRIHKFNL